MTTKRYRYKGKFISAAKARALRNLKNARRYVKVETVSESAKRRLVERARVQAAKRALEQEIRRAIDVDRKVMREAIRARAERVDRAAASTARRQAREKKLKEAVQKVARRAEKTVRPVEDVIEETLPEIPGEVIEYFGRGILGDAVPVFSGLDADESEFFVDMEMIDLEADETGT